MGNNDVNSIVAQALQNAGVRPADIQLPPEPSKSIPVSESADTKTKPTNLDGTLKGQTKGETLEERAEREASDAEDETKGETKEPPKLGAGEPAEQKPLTQSDITKILDQASSRFQSIMDKRINQINTQLQGTISALNQYFETQETANLSGLPENEQVLKRLERLETGKSAPKIQIAQPVEQQQVPFYQYLVNVVDAVGLKIDDSRIDWAPDESDAKSGFSRFLASVKKALVDDQTKAIKELKEQGEREITKVRKKTGVDKVSTTGPAGVGNPNVDKMTPFQKIEHAFKEAEVLSANNQ